MISARQPRITFQLQSANPPRYNMQQGQSPPGDEPGLEIVFYDPGASESQPLLRRRADPRPRWERPVDQILSARPENLAPIVLRSLPPPRQPNEEIIDTARRLVTNILRDQNQFTRRCKELLLGSLCIVIHRLGYNSPEDIDSVLAMLSEGSSSKYLGALKRGAKTANEIIFEWATWQGQRSDRSRIGLTTTLAFQGTYSHCLTSGTGTYACSSYSVANSLGLHK